MQIIGSILAIAIAIAALSFAISVLWPFFLISFSILLFLGGGYLLLFGLGGFLSAMDKIKNAMRNRKVERAEQNFLRIQQMRAEQQQKQLVQDTNLKKLVTAVRDGHDTDELWISCHWFLSKKIGFNKNLTPCYICGRDTKQTVGGQYLCSNCKASFDLACGRQRQSAKS
ncbi:hypothetical protein [Vibrio alfacsensis]|uniref:hypothetical protein n=1 Tax=Vibrio alfacsensis TaxID=1074311 RepID=UPI0040681441